MIEVLREAALKATAEWVDSMGSESIRRRVFEILDRSLDEVVHKLLGFDNRWGRWEVDQCNGRNSQTIVGQFIQTHARRSVQDWLLEQVQELPSLNSQEIASIKKEWKDTYLRGIRAGVSDRAKAAASEQLDALLASLDLDPEGAPDLLEEYAKIATALDKKKSKVVADPNLDLDY